MKWTNKGHQFDEIGVFLKELKGLYIYGAGQMGKELFELLQWLKINDISIAFVDMDPKKQKNGFLGYEVISPDQYFQLSKDNQIIIVATSTINSRQIAQSLSDSGYLEDHNFFTMQKFVEFYLPIYVLYKNDKIFFPSIGYIPTTKCNLNCEACLNFKPFNKDTKHRNWEDVKRDIDAYFRCVDYTHIFQISGGEPLLYPYINDVVKYIGENYRHKINILYNTTNATIVPSESLCKLLSRYNVTYIVDDYRDSIPKNMDKYKEVVEQLSKYSVCIKENKVDKWIKIYPSNHVIDDQLDDSYLINYYDSCKEPWQDLCDQKLYSCSYASYAIRAGLITDSPNDYYELSSFTSADKNKLIEFRLRHTEKGYLDFCKSCNGYIAINKNFVNSAVQTPL